LDPDRDYLLIFHTTFGTAFGWEVSRALDLALFRTFGVPSISELLDRTGEFAHRGQKRYDDTVALLREVARDGPSSPRGRTAVKRVNWIHGAYDISNDDYLYVLATFVVVPVRWIRRYGWRDLTAGEIRAAVHYYRELGQLMGIHQIPLTYAEFASYLDAYEREHYSYCEASRRLAASLTEVIEGWFPPLLRPLARPCIAAALDRPLRHALGLPEPSGAVRAGVHIALRCRAALMRLLPPLRPGRRDSRRLRSYPDGYLLTDLGPAWAAGSGRAAAGTGLGARMPEPPGAARSCALARTCSRPASDDGTSIALTRS
jgi:hypothetical protein